MKIKRFQVSLEHSQGVCPVITHYLGILHTSSKLICSSLNCYFQHLTVNIVAMALHELFYVFVIVVYRNPAIFSPSSAHRQGAAMCTTSGWMPDVGKFFLCVGWVCPITQAIFSYPSRFKSPISQLVSRVGFLPTLICKTGCREGLTLSVDP